MKSIAGLIGVALVFVGTVTASGQERDAARVLADARLAMGGDALTSVKSLVATGRTLRPGSSGRTTESEVEITVELPERFLVRSVLMAMGDMSIYRHSGFDGNRPIDEIDSPPNLAGGLRVDTRIRTGGGAGLERMSPEARAELEHQRLLDKKREFARLALGMLGSSFTTYPLQLTYVGEAEASEGRAEVLDVKGEGDFAARLFIDCRTHLPLMLSWMDKEPMALASGGSAGVASVEAPSIGIVAREGSGTISVRGASPAPVDGSGRVGLTKEELEKRDASRRLVEYRVFYADYQHVGGILLPHRILSSIDGKTTEERIFESFRVNSKIDAKKFRSK